MMRQRNLLLIVIVILGLVVTLGLQGCGLLGGGGDDEGGEGAPAEGAEPGAEGAPPGEMPGEPPADGGMGGPPPGMEGPVPEGAPAEPGMEGAPAEPGMEGAPMGEAADGGADAGQLVAEGMAAKHDGDYVTARQKFEAAVAADPGNAEAHWGLAWIYAEMADSGQPSMEPKAIEQFEKFLEIGGTQEQVAEAEAALDRLQ